jgi:NAD(P)-dependent dehydrogenase (short-subunit alcohol dehydrogenase family)
VEALAHQVAIVTGASSGIGRGIAFALADAGATVIATARSESRLRDTSDVIVKAGGIAHPARCDVTSESQITALFEQVEAERGPIEILVNGAGVFDSGAVDEITLETWRRVLDVNLTGAFLCTREAMRRMKTRKRGRILNIGSISSFVPRPMSAPYAASKAGLVGLSRAAAIEGRDHGISVGCLHPGNVATEMRQQGDDPMNREPMMSVEEIAKLAVAMLTVGAGSTVWELTALPIDQAYLGRG